MDQNVGNVENKKGSSRFGAWCKRHKTAIIGYGTALGLTILGVVIGVQVDKSKQGPSMIAGLMPDPPEHDYGRDLVMKFFDKETGEPYKEEGISCTEEFANDMYDVM